MIRVNSVSVSLLLTSVPLFQVTGVSVSPGEDQLIVVHLSSNNDLVLCLTTTQQEDRVGEMVGQMCKLYKG